MNLVERSSYVGIYGPTVGDRIRLADTDLRVEVEADDTSYGDEILGGCGRTWRDGMLTTSRPDSALDMLISNVVLLDPILGVRKTNIGIADGRVIGVGRAGNPDVVDNPDLVASSHTALIPGEGLIATPGIIDSHVHLSSPAMIEPALSSGITTLVGMGVGGVWDVGVNPEYHLHRVIEAFSEVPLNVSFLARGGASEPGLLEKALAAGASGFKVHEDFGATPRNIDVCLGVAERADVAVALHTDTLNESGLLSDTVAAINGRTVHAYHVEGSGGGHPNVLELTRLSHVLPSSTTPTLPYAENTLAELFPMTMTVHRQHPSIESDVEVARSRVRANTVAAESVLQDLGAIPITNSDAMGMGRIGELVRRTWQLAAYTRGNGGRDAAPDNAADNERVLRYLAKLTINPAIAHGLAGEVGSIAPGKLADVVLWHPAWFGAAPELVVKSGFVAWGVGGSGAGSTRLCQPRVFRAYFGSMGAAPAHLGVVFVSGAADRSKLPSGRRYAVVRRSRDLDRSAMVRNTLTPAVEVPTDGSPVLVDHEPVTLEPARRLPLTQAHHVA